MDEKLMNLNCPFTWEMEDVIASQNKLLGTKDDRYDMIDEMKDDFPEYVVIYHLMEVFENVMKKGSASTTQEYIIKAEEKLDDIKKKGMLTNVENVLEHIFIAMKCHIHKKLEELEKVQDLLEAICDVKNMNKTELAMLSGCQCLAWSLYYVTENLKAINYANKAMELDPGNAKWWFLIGTNYRRLRRSHQPFRLPSKNETVAFKQAAKLSKNVLFRISLAQLYRESRNYDDATKIYKEVYALQPTSCLVRLRLALGFIRVWQCELAKSCLKYVREKIPDAIMYTHYMAIYEEKCTKNHRAALPYYESTTKKGNFGGEWGYIKCKKRVEPVWDPLPYMLELFIKYGEDVDHFTVEINIHIGSYYLFELDDILRACEYLTKVIEMQPNAGELKNHLPDFHKTQRVNLYEVLTEKVESALENPATYYTDEIAMLNKTLQLCRDNLER